MYTQITCSGKPAQSKVFHALIHYYTNADNRLVCITWLSGPIRAERTVMCITCSGWIWCFEECMSSVMLLQVQQLDGAEHIVSSRETPSPPQTETQSTQNGEGETPDRPHAISVVSLSVSSSFSRSLQSSSFSSITDSTMSLNIITVTLNMGEYISVCLLLNMHCSVKHNMNDTH